MPESLMPLLTGLFLVFAGMLIGYFLWFRDRTQDEAIQLKLRHENDELRNQMGVRKTKINELENSLTSQQGKLHIMQELCDDLVSGREQSEASRAAMETEMAETRRRLEESERLLDLERRERVDLEDRLHTVTLGHNNELMEQESNWRERFQRVETDLAARVNDIHHLTLGNERMSAELHEARSRVAELTAELETQQTLLETATQNVTGLEKEYVSLETSLRGHTELLSESRAQSAAALSAKQLAEDALQDLRRQLDDQKLLIAKMDSIRSEAEAARVSVAQLEKAVADRDERITALIAERDHAMQNDQLRMKRESSFTARLENQEATIRKLRTAGEEYALRLKSEKDARLTSETTSGELIIRLRNELQGCRREIESLTENRSELSEQVVELQHLRQQRDRLITEVQRGKEMLSTSMQECKVLENRITEFETVRNERDHLQQELNASTEQLASMEQSLEKLSIQLSELEGLRIERDRLQQILEDGELRRLAIAQWRNQEHDQVRMFIGKMRSELVSTESQRQGLASEHDRLVMMLEAARDDNLQLRADLEALQSELDANVLSDEEQTEIQTRLNHLIRQRDQAFEETNTLRAEIESLQAQLDSLQTQMAEPEVVSLKFQQEDFFDREYSGQMRLDPVLGKLYVSAPEFHDDLKLISGIATVLEKQLNEYGVYTYRQIMEWAPDAVAEFSERLPTFKDRIERDDWIGQAAALYEQSHRKAA